MAESHKRKQARAVLTRAGYSAGGHMTPTAVKGMVKRGIHEHEENMHRGSKETRIKLASGGEVTGDAAKSRGDKKGRGGKGKASTKINIIVAPHPPGGAPAGPPAMAAPPVMARPPMPPAPPPRPPMGAPPPGAPGMAGPMKTGGSVKLTAASGSAKGREEKAEAESKQSGGKRRAGGSC
jgi:hypothetical protein